MTFELAVYQLPVAQIQVQDVDRRRDSGSSIVEFVVRGRSDDRVAA